MPIQIACPSCRRPLRVPDDLLGTTVKCPGCEEVFQADVNETTSNSASDSPPRSRREDDGYRDTIAPRPKPPRREEIDEDEFDDLPPRRFHRDLPPHRGTMILVLGIISIFIAWNFAPLGLVLGIPAWVMGSHDLKLMRQGLMDPRGESHTNTGRILGIIGTCLSALLSFCCVGYIIFVIVMQ